MGGVTTLVNADVVAVVFTSEGKFSKFRKRDLGMHKMLGLELQAEIAPNRI